MEHQVLDTSYLLKMFLLTSIIGLWLNWLWSRRTFYRFAWKFPGFFGLPFIGTIEFVKNPKSALQIIGNLLERCKQNNICIWAGIYPLIISSEPEVVEKILSSSEFLDKAKTFYSPVYQTLDGGIIFSPECVWRKSRKMINPSFNYKVLLRLLPIFHKGKLNLISNLGKMTNNGEHKLVDIIHRITLGMTVETTMGKRMEPGDQVEEEVVRNFRFIIENIVFRLLLSCVNLDILYKLYYKSQLVKRQLKKFVLELLKIKLEKIEEPARNNIEASDGSFESIKKTPKIFIDHAIEVYQKGKCSLNDIVIESNNIVAASFETTGNAIFSVILMLAIHPEIQENLYEEIVNFSPEKDFELKYEDMDQLPYLDRILNETMRVAPPVPLIGRLITKDFQLSSEHKVPKGFQVILSLYHLHRRKDVWGEDADKFNPNNFLSENIKGMHPYAYVPFSKGLRDCVGWRYALFSMKVILVGIVRNFRFTTTTKYEDIKFTFHLVLKYLNEPSFEIYHRD